MDGFQNLTLSMRGTSTLETTMGKQRKTWSTDVKEAIVLSVLRGELGVAEAARQHGANESLIHTWKTQFLEAGRAHVLCRTAPVWGLPASPVTVRTRA